MTSDQTVIEYWENQSTFVTKYIDNYFSTRQYEKTFTEYLNNKRGLLQSSQSAIHQALSLIAVDYVDIALEHAKWAKRFAENAIEVGDLGDYRGWPTVFGLHYAYEQLYYAKWLLKEPDGEEVLKKSLQFLMRYRLQYDRPAMHETAGNKDADTWGYVVPFLIGGQRQNAQEQLDLIYKKLEYSVNQPLQNSETLPQVLNVLLRYLGGNEVSETIARETIELFFYNMSGWGHKGRGLRAKLWDQLVIEQHVAFAIIRALYFTKEHDPIAVVQSIRGIPV